MRGLTSILRSHFVKSAERTLKAADNILRSQEEQLAMLLRFGRKTSWGHRYRMSMVGGYDDFRKEVPVVTYEDIRAEVMKMVSGEKDILWPGRVKRFAQSSGTSDGKSKFIPITDISLRLNHYRGGSESVGQYLRQNPLSKIFDGKAFILGGSFANELHLNVKGVKIGDLSANLIDAINPLVNLLRVPSKDIALMEDWGEKLPELIESAANQDITNISGVPSWFLTVLQGVIKYKGAASIHDVWPRLEVFFHGGISFRPYRSQYELITDSSRMHYLETYNASEGFFAVQTDKGSDAMMLLPDAGVFYEFIPTGCDVKQAIPAWEVKKGELYSLVITACNGLWRYQIGDVVKVEETLPLMISIAGRTKHFINAFGEEVMVHNTDAAIEKTCQETGCHIMNYTVAPVFSVNGQKGRHQWLIEFDVPPADLNEFAKILDLKLQAENSDYQAKRQHDIFLDCLSVTTAREGLFDDWLRKTGKLGGQRKIPRLSNERQIFEKLLEMNK